MNNMYTRWLDIQLQSLFLEYLEVIKAYELAKQYREVTERIKDFNNSISTVNYCIHYG